LSEQLRRPRLSEAEANRHRAGSRMERPAVATTRACRLRNRTMPRVAGSTDRAVAGSSARHCMFARQTTHLGELPRSVARADIASYSAPQWDRRIFRSHPFSTPGPSLASRSVRSASLPARRSRSIAPERHRAASPRDQEEGEAVGTALDSLSVCVVTGAFGNGLLPPRLSHPRTQHRQPRWLSGFSERYLPGRPNRPRTLRAVSPLEATPWRLWPTSLETNQARHVQL